MDEGLHEISKISLNDALTLVIKVVCTLRWGVELCLVFSVSPDELWELQDLTSTVRRSPLN